MAYQLFSGQFNSACNDSRTVPVGHIDLRWRKFLKDLALHLKVSDVDIVKFMYKGILPGKWYK